MSLLPGINAFGFGQSTPPVVIPATENVYDSVPYPKQSHPGSQIRQLETLATLFDMPVLPTTNCRVLELGCAAGWNLIPQAASLPGSRFLGVDSSPSQIADGQQMIQGVGLENVELRSADILEIDAAWGEFDYIICHGVYSWVPEPVRKKILDIFRDNLAPLGVAHVSYNVLPGWHFRGIVRDMMLYHVSQFSDPREQISQARAAIDFLVENCPRDTAYGKALEEELQVIAKVDDAYLFHDHLEENNHPVYFHEFNRQIEERGLQYLGDSNFSQMLSRHLTPQARSALQNTSIVKQEQYMDFLRNNTFRQTLLCRQSVKLNRSLSSDVIERFHMTLSSPLEPAEFDVASDETVRLQSGKQTINCERPLLKSAFQHLATRRPGPVTLDELHGAVQQILSGTASSINTQGNKSRTELAQAMLDAYSTGLLHLWVHPPQCTGSIEDFPKVSSLVRWQAAHGHRVTNHFHENVSFDECTRRIITRLDGTHDRESLAAGIEQDIAKGILNVEDDASPSGTPNRQSLTGPINQSLAKLCRSALLEA